MRHHARFPLSAVAALALLAGASIGPLPAQELSGPRRTAYEMAEAASAEVEEMAMTLWEYSETALRETQSASYLADLLEEEGFRVERGVAEMPTAFVATWGSGAPVIGILAEFDALPGVGNAPVPTKTPREDGHPHGHGCGHNLFGAASVGSALALKRTMEADGLEGTIRLYGTPAEETVVGKVYMARDGLFDGLDAALTWHPGQESEVDNSSSLAMNNFEVTFFGQSAHGAADPWNGRSALDAVELMTEGINLMREHVRPSTRMHYVIPDGGGAPNVVPDRATIWMYVRDTSRVAVEKHYDWLVDIAEGAALGSRTEREVHLITGVHATLLNRPLQEMLQRNMEVVGPPEFTHEDQEFGRRMQRFLEVGEDGFSDELEPLADEPEPAGGGSTDVAEVSRLTPTAQFSVTTAPANVPWHSWATSAAHGTDAAVRGARVATKVLALAGVDLLTDPELLREATAYFEEAMGGREYVSPLPEGQKPPVPGDVARGGSGR
ncbi:MAG: amidohydrolase [Gemmatimonadetes bacterium]|nr:amidohydrolase [Gemmatimonadota bacterium]NIR79680.1 amidohydrolase [Gemmatimonadota bacterium]NIT88386.1 amidohydrolase [Gemmatimonadota bacterium]NIU32201.1 amidohydrolase [Gemmatimonadota bacterium]NIU36752.1 amidohydrolase [Gemmatimonadota bacterium]